MTRPVIVEGVFLLHTLRKLDVGCDFLVYVENKEQVSEEYLETRLSRYEQTYSPRESSKFVFAWDIDR